MDALLEQIPSNLLSEWMAYESLEPFGYEVDMLGHAITASIIAETSQGKPKGKHYEPKDFMPVLRSERHTESEPADIMQGLRSYLGLAKYVNSD